MRCAKYTSFRKGSTDHPSYYIVTGKKTRIGVKKRELLYVKNHPDAKPSYATYKPSPNETLEAWRDQVTVCLEQVLKGRRGWREAANNKPKTRRVPVYRRGKLPAKKGKRPKVVKAAKTKKTCQAYSVSKKGTISCENWVKKTQYQIDNSKCKRTTSWVGYP